MATRHVAPHPDGGWQVTDPVGRDSPTRTTTQDEAVSTAHEQLLVRDGGGELVIHGFLGRGRPSQEATGFDGPGTKIFPTFCRVQTVRIEDVARSLPHTEVGELVDTLSSD
ncbi:DUF2188 domain-containing protein [Saccharopolyspora sp. NPDC003752]